jgi:hypothetical protein
MAIETWVVVGQKNCDLIQQDVELREQRVYASADLLRDFAGAYRIRACVCTAAIDCNLAGISCKWAFNAPATDRF